ncbi:PucR family transcriptional regulator [Siminovitchia sp. FSL W7-1587]|uniref:PucR family transcriptional regulator n=1 Tax=Siminovitchia sp. FSL W7-1587 TaxID=2954699 RepID=UPI0030D21FC8
MSNELTLTVQDIMRRPLFQRANMIAGLKGRDRPVEWVHILEDGHSGIEINGNEFILTTVHFFDRARDVYMSYLNELLRQKAAALCVVATAEQIPSDVCRFADEYEFPIILLDDKVRFVDITKDIHMFIVNDHAKTVLELEAYSKELSHLTLQSRSIGHILQAFYRFTSHHIVYYPIDGNAVTLPQTQKQDYESCIQIFHEQILRDHQGALTQTETITAGNITILYQPVTAMGQVLAYVAVLLHDGGGDRYMTRALDYTVTAIAHHLLRELFIEERNLQNQALLLDDLVNNRMQSEELMRTKLGIVTQDIHNFSYYCGVIQWGFSKSNWNVGERNSLLQNIAIVTRTIMNRHQFHPVTLTMGNRLYFLVYQVQAEHKNMLPIQKRIETATDQVKHAMNQFLTDGDFLIGMSKANHMLTDAYEAFQQARQVIEVAQITESITDPFYEHIGIFRILLNVKNNQTIHSLIQDYVGEVLKHDQQNGAELLKTLKAYLNNNGSKQATANELFIHRQTVNYRVEQLHELLGDFMDPDRRICIEVALRAYELHRIHFF